MALAQRQTPGEDWVVVGRGDQEEAADDEQQQEVRLGMLEAISDDQRLVRWERGWGLEVTADDQRPVRWEGGWGLELEATADDQKQRCVLLGEVRQWELESARREGEGEGAPQQQSTACQNERRTRSVWKRWVAADSCRFCLVLCDGL